MNSIIDNSLVGLALIASAGYAVASLGPRSVRRGLLSALGAAMLRAPRFLGLGPIARRIAAASAEKAAGACGGCDNCGSEQTAAPNPPAAEVSVPVANIGRRT
jgi:hypothetical protein